MPIPQKIVKFLEKSKIKYESIKHRTVYTAFDKAATLRVPQKIIGKTLVVKLDKNPTLILIPANRNLDKQKLKKIAKAKSIDASAGSASTLSSCRRVDFLKEVWMKKNLKGVKIGAIPPFGSLWGLVTFMDRGLVKNPKIILNSGDYNFSIKISPSIFKKLTPNLVIGSFSKSRK